MHIKTLWIMATFKRIVHSPFSLGCDGMSSYPIHSTTPFSSTNKNTLLIFYLKKLPTVPSSIVAIMSARLAVVRMEFSGQE